MANTDRPRGFRPVSRNPRIGVYKADGSQTIAVGDLVLMDSDGYIDICTEGNGALIVGVAASAVTSATEGDTIYVWDDPETIFVAQTSDTFAQADIYDSKSYADMTGTTGIQEVKATDNTNGCLRILGLASDPATGQTSAVGANATVYVKIASPVHLWGSET